MLLWVDPASRFDEGEPPPWVAGWVATRTKQAEARRQKAERTGKAPANPAARSKREAARMSKVAAGLEDLDLWLGDLVRSGFANLGSRQKDLWDEQARRMIDAQCPGVARRLRQIDAMSLAGQGWQAALLDRLAQIHLLIEGFRHLDSLPAEAAEDVKTAIGFPIDFDAVRSGESGTHVRNTWRVLGQAFAIEDKVTVRRTSLWGRDSRRSAVLLDFSAAGRPFEPGLEPGTEIDATLGFPPGAAPIRALLIERHASPELFGRLDGGATIDDAQGAFAAALARSPWVDLIPVVLGGISLRQLEETWSAVDLSGTSVALASGFDQGWNIEALTGGDPFTLTGEFDGSTLNPLSAIIDGRFLPLVTPATKPTTRPVSGSPGRWLTPDSVLLLEATTSAVVGVDRKLPPTVSPDHPVGPIVAQVQSRLAPARLLAVAAAAGLSARAGRKPRVDSSQPHDRAPATEDRPQCSPEAARRLQSLFEGVQGASPIHDPDLFFEWFDDCNQANQRLPFEQLIDVLSAFEKNTDAVDALTPILGHRGRWLARRNPRWAFLAGRQPVQDITSTWETGKKTERLNLLRWLRSTRPEEARRLVELTFRSESATLRSEIVTLFEENLSDEDENFLESILDDRSPEVRAASGKLLTQLPGSQLVARMVERSQRLLRWEGDGLVIDLPDHDKSMNRDGITEEPGPSRRSGSLSLGKKAWYLHEILSRTPVASVSNHLKQSPAKIIGVIRSSEWANLVLDAWEISALRDRDSAWCHSLVLDQLANNEISLHSSHFKLLAILNPEVRDSLIASKLSETSMLLRSSDTSFHLLWMSKETIGVDLGREVLLRLQALITQEQWEVAENGSIDSSLSDPALRVFVNGIDRKLPFELLDQMDREFDFNEIFTRLPQLKHRSLTADYASMLDRWKFRRDMHQEFFP